MVRESRVAPLRTRFAPSPTGYLHLGHIASAIYVWGVARRIGGEVCLRIEDHDQSRSRPEYVIQILEDLSWLGFEWVGEHHVQMENQDRYRKGLELLDTEGSLFNCSCSRKDILEFRNSSHQELWYPGTCRFKKLNQCPSSGVRWMVPQIEVSFEDLLLGLQSQKPAEQCGDLLLKDRHGNFTYHFSTVVDDIWDKIDFVVRGQDLLESSGRQLLLARSLGRLAPIRYYHHPLITDHLGNKLAKKSFSEPIKNLRDLGYSKESLLGEAAFQVGILPKPQKIKATIVEDLVGFNGRI